MKTLPVSLLWLFILCFACGQISDIPSIAEDSFARTDGFGEENNSTGIFREEDHNKENQSFQNGKLDATEEEKEKFDGDNENRNQTGNQKPKVLTEKPLEDSTQTPSFERFTGRGRRKFVTQRSSTTSNLTGMPSMSPERRNSYLSIAERRKYYNKTHSPTRKPEIVETELDNQETVNKLVTSSLASAALESLQVNEIPVSRKPSIKDSGRGAFVLEIKAEKKNQTDNSKVHQGPPEKPKKIQSTRQSVIQSQYEFGQKLNSRKSPSRVPEGILEDKSKRNKDKIVVEPVIENITFKPLKSAPIQSTELHRVNKNPSTTTAASEVFQEDNVTVGYNNKTNVLEMAEYVTINRTQGPPATEVASKPIDSTINSSFILDSNRVSEGIRARGRSEPIKLAPFPLNYVNSSSERSGSTDNEEEAKQLATNIQNVYNQEILRINSTRKTVKVPLSLLKSFQKNSRTNSSQSQSQASQTVSTVPSEVDTLIPETLPTSPNYSESVNESSSIKPNDSSSEKDDFEKKTKTNINNLPISNNNGTLNSQAPQEEESVGVTKEPKDNATSFPPSDFQNSDQEYPVTIELNENNKRILSEMFSTPKTTESTSTTARSPVTIATTINSRKNSSFPEARPDEEKTTVTSPSVLPVTPEVHKEHGTAKPITTEGPVEISIHQFSDEDKKAMGTRYNTKFYISPNASRTQQKVIKVVEAEDEDEEDQQHDDGGVTRLANPVGITAYILAAFGIVPLLLAAVFAAKFVMDRRQRRYDCESDGKSDSISTSECQTRLSKGKKTSGDLKKSPSNVTTTTLVTASRLPRVHHHWATYDKQGNKNWEIPRSRLKMKTILGQGNFGQAIDRILREMKERPDNSSAVHLHARQLESCNQVWKAEVEDIAGHDGKTRLVAVKTVKEGAGEKEHKEFIKELEIMQQIGSHPNIVTLLGCCTDQEPHYLIMEYVKYGKLLTYLREHRMNENYYNFSNNEDALTSKDLTIFAYCISQGMEYLVSRGIIHRDLAARNVLVDHNKVCKIADFGMSRSIRNFEDGQVYEERQHKGALPIRWMAPESLVYSVFTHKSDVWSFGIVMWEIVTLGSIPYPNMGAREIMRRVRDGYRLERPSHCKPEFFRLMSHCWAHDPNKRPDFSELREDLSNLLENPSKDGSYVDLDRFAVDNGYHISGKSRDFRLMERKDCRPLKRLGGWDTDWPEEIKRTRTKKGKNNGKGTVTLTGQGSFTVNSRILEKEFKMI